MGWWRRLSLRSRLMMLGVGGLTVGLAVGGVVLIAVLGVTLQRSVDAEATRTGEDVARLVEEGALPEPVPVAGAQLVQVVDARSRVLAASINADRLVPMLRDAELARVRDGGKLFVDGDRVGGSGPVRVVAVPAASAGGDPRTVLVAKPLADLRESLHAVRVTLLVAFPLLVAAVAVVAWRVVGATLRPVEALRAGAAAISAGAAAPGTGVGGSGGRDRGGGDPGGGGSGGGDPGGGGSGAGRWPAALPVPASQDEIHRLAVTLNDMLHRLETARARQRAFVADAAHELLDLATNPRLRGVQRLGG